MTLYNMYDLGHVFYLVWKVSHFVFVPAYDVLNTQLYLCFNLTFFLLFLIRMGIGNAEFTGQILWVFTVVQ